MFSTQVLSNSELTNNSADSSGGAINVGASGSLSMHASDSNLTYNSANYDGGAIFVFCLGNVSISNCELKYNSANHSGGAISNSELTNNVANEGGVCSNLPP